MPQPFERNYSSWCLLLWVVTVINITNGFRDRIIEETPTTFPAWELQALHDLYTATSGENWNWFLNGTIWDFTATANPCEDNWQGVTCAQLNNTQIVTVKSLLLPGQNLVGTIPSSISSLTNLATLNLGQNHINGTIPPEIGNIASLYDLSLYANKLTGTLPASLGQIVGLHTIYLYDNELSGTIPDAVWKLENAATLIVWLNHLTGTIPSGINILPFVKYFYLNYNQFEGTIPASVGSLQHLQALWLFNNAFTGTIPDTLCNSTKLKEISFNHNKLHGVLPERVGDLTFLEKLTVADNLLTGTIPQSISSLPFLVTMEVSNNNLWGPLEGIFDSKLQIALTNLEIDNNQLSGSLPEELFLMPKLATFTVVSNCFHGRLPQSVCRASSVVSLVMDGLSSAASCRNTLFPGLSSTYLIVNSVRGTIPSCLLELPLISTLHLSGNGFTGTLPSNVTLSPQLVDLSLSHNILTGSIPSQFQQRRWIILDLSYNRLAGSLLPSFGTDTRYPGRLELLNQSAALVVLNNYDNNTDYSLSLQGNRISGKIPGTLHDMHNITILGTNVFSCDLSGNDLPQHDSDRSNYQCGSNSFDVTYFMWLGLGFVTGSSVLLWYLFYNKLYSSTSQLSIAIADGQKWFDMFSKAVAVPGALKIVFDIANALGRIGLCCAAFIVIVLLPIYIVASSYYDTFAYQYAWTTSAVYMSGVTPLVLLITFWLALLAIFLGCAHYNLFCIKPVARRPISVYLAGLRTYGVSQWPIMSIYIVYILINVFVVVGVNIAYVYVAVYEDSGLLVAAQVLLSFFKIIWNNKVTYYVLDRTVHYLQPANQNMKEQDFVSLQLLVTLQNNVVLPCLVVACISRSCFHRLFVAAPVVRSVVLLTECAIPAVNGLCRLDVRVLTDTVYKPPFRYGYQCSSSLVTYYSPAFVNLCIVGTFVSPVAQAVGMHLYARSRPGTWWHAVLSYNLPTILKPLDVTTPSPSNKRYFRPNVTLNSLVTYLALMMTFGAVFPPLAVALVITLFASAFYSKVKVGRFLYNAHAQNELDVYSAALEGECAAVESSVLMHSSVWMLITLSCWFYTPFLFDTLGDAVGFDHAYWVLIVMPLMPLVLYSLYSGYLYLAGPTKHLASPGDGIELGSPNDSPENIESKSDEEVMNIILSSPA